MLTWLATSGLSAVLGFLAKFLVDLVADWRRDRALKDLGSAETRAGTAEAALVKERDYAKIDATPADRASTSQRMRDGTF